MSEAPTPGATDPLDLHGVVPPTVTAFDEDGDLDLETTADHARFVVERGAHAVFPLGTNGEFALLSDSERDRVIEAVVDAVGDEVPVIPGVGKPGTRSTQERVRAAAEAGADGLVVVTPYYYPLDHAAAVEHYRQVTAVTDRPVYLYHIPSKTGNALSLSALEDIAALDGIAGLKDSSKDVPWLGQAIAANPDLTFLAGSDSLLVPGLDLGCSGVVSAVANAFPELVVDLYDAYDAGDRERAQELQETVYEVRSALKEGPYMAGVKEALSIRGFDAGPLRSPLRRMDDEDAAELEATLRDLGLVS
ncbi:MAG: dihydrodipicolinate synthase family protein [Halodesulfurarchaeum sp.]